jgi:hypothetical protein
VPLSSAQSTPDPSARSGPFFAGSPNSSAAAPNGTSLPPLRASGTGPVQFQDIPRSERERDPAYDSDNPTPGDSRENGAQPYGSGATGEPVTAGPDVHIDANGDRRIVASQSQDVEMGDAPPVNSSDTGPGGSAAGEAAGGFTAVNQNR